MLQVVQEDREYQRILPSDKSIDILEANGLEWVFSSNVSAATVRGKDLIVRFHATDNIWSGCPTYGQVSIDWVELYGCGTPWEAPTVINAYKVVCDDETYLPNWGDGSGPSQITKQVIDDFVTDNSCYCHLEPNWDFQWGFAGEAQKQDGDHIGPAPTGTGWYNFDSSTGSGIPAQVVIDDLQETAGIWVRENLKPGYVPFANPPGDLQNSTSAEMYCYNDVYNYEIPDRT